MDPSFAAALACLALIVVAFVVLVVRVLAAIDAARADGRAQERRVADEQLAGRDATIRGLQAELAADRDADGDGEGAAQGLVREAERLAGASGARGLWDPRSGGPAGAGGHAPPAPAPPG